MSQPTAMNLNVNHIGFTVETTNQARRTFKEEFHTILYSLELSVCKHNDVENKVLSRQSEWLLTHQICP
jgi:hypothetical protein